MWRVLILFLFPVIHCCPDGFFNSVGTCCKLCPAGTFVKSPCNKDRGTECAECKEGSTFTEQSNKDTSCKHCTQCQGDRVQTSPCTKTRDRGCECPDGRFFNLALLFCFDCPVCPEGEGTNIPCRGSNKSECSGCIEGKTFSNTSSHLEACRACTKCRGETLSSCTLISDTVCAFFNITTSRPPTTFMSVAQPSIRSKRTAPLQDKKTSPIYIVTGVIAGVAVVLLVILGICCQIYRRRPHTSTPASSEAGGGDPDNVSTNTDDDERGAEDIQPLPMHPPPLEVTHQDHVTSHPRSTKGLRGRKSHRGGGTRHASVGNSTGYSAPEVFVKQVKMARDLPGHVILEIEERLNPDGPNNWIHLADRLGATQLEIANYRLVPEKATQKVIQSWCVREAATVNELCNALKDIKRPDCLSIVKPYSSYVKKLR